MRKSLKSKLLSLCVVTSIITNIGLQGASAESISKNSIYGNIIGITDSQMKTDNIEIEEAYDVEYQPNDYIEPTYRFIVKYIDPDGEKIDAKDKIPINEYMETLIVNSDVEMDEYIDETKWLNDNIDYIQPDYKLVLSEADLKANIYEETPNVDIREETTLIENISDKFLQSENVEEDILCDNKNIENNDVQEDYIEQKVETENTDEFEESYGSKSFLKNEPNKDDIVVAVIDTGIYAEHEALKEKIWVNSSERADETDNDGNGFVDDVSGWDFVNNMPITYDESKIVDYSHGTHIAGIISGESAEIKGVHSNAKIMPLKAFENGSAYTADIIRAIEYADMMGASIVNCSFGSCNENRALKDTIADCDMIFVCAAGNYAADIKEKPFYPALYDFENVISVSASDDNGEIAFFSNYGDTIDITAPGYSIRSSVPENEYGNSSGTSSAAAYISGIIADELGKQSLHLQDLLNRAVNRIEVDTESENEYKEELIADSSIMNWSKKNFSPSLKSTSVMRTARTEATPRPIQQIAAGGHHSMVLVDGRVYAFGANDHNQIDGQMYFADDAAEAPGNEILNNVEKISTRGDHNLALMNDGTVYSWGANSYGELGLGYVGGENITDGYVVAEQVIGLSNIVDISAGHQFSLALDSNGRIYAWGSNREGQLGINNTYTFFTTPQLIGTLTNVSQISAGHYHALAMTEDGTVYGWGRASNGALGDVTGEK